MGGATYLADNPVVAFDAAINRAHTHKATPVLLVVNSQSPGVNARWNKRIGFPNDILADEIPVEAITATYKLAYLKRNDLAFAEDPARALKVLFEPVKLVPSPPK